MFLLGVKGNFAVWIGFVIAISAGTGSASEASQEFISNSTSYIFFFTAVVTLAGISGPLSSAVGCGRRVLQLLLNLEQIEASPLPSVSVILPSSSIGNVACTTPEAQPVVGIRMDNVSVIAPSSDTPLLSGLSMRVPENTIIMGPSGCGKSSVLRVIAGIAGLSLGFGVSSGGRLAHGHRRTVAAI